MQSSTNNNDELSEVTEINVTPLADVTLVLLILLMVLSPMALQSLIQVQAAQAVAVPQRQSIQEKPIFVDITPTGFTINNKPVATEYELFRALQINLLGKQDKTVLVSSERTVLYQNVVRVLDLVRQSGAVSLSLVPHKESAS